MEAVKPLCDLCVRLGVFDSIMLSYQASDDVFDTPARRPVPLRKPKRTPRAGLSRLRWLHVALRGQCDV